VIAEDELFHGGKRIRTPGDKEWVFEGSGRAWTEGGRLHIENDQDHPPELPGHVVLWNTRSFPADFLLEFALSPQDSANGLGIVFFNATSREGRSIFDPGLSRRDGLLPKYAFELNCYHVSYWATSEYGTPRRTTNLRKNPWCYLAACGNDLITGAGPGPHLVRVLKQGGKIRVETCGKMSLVFDDDGATHGPVWQAGRIGLRQMKYTVRGSYTHFKVWQVTAR